ncbi:MAG: multicopper oxidase domain-containing protein [Chloroflexi bacterium]|nr:multicopper oxidase domain-containing protein [Chloroflexota bacterium]
MENRDKDKATHAEMGHDMRPRVSRAQIVLVTLLTLGMLAAGVLVAGWFGDFSMRAGTVMEGQTMPGMSGSSMPGMAGSSMGGHEMQPVDVSQAPAAPIFARGNQPLEFTLVNGIKEYHLTPQVVRWSILPTVQVGAYSYNGTVPGPMLRLTVGDRVRFVVKNELPEPTSIHWHGLQIDNSQDGAADVTQKPIEPGETFMYEWTVPPTPGTFFYHTHFSPDRQQTLGLYGLLEIETQNPVPTVDVDVPILLQEWTVINEVTFPAMDFAGMQPNFFTINGKSYPETETINVKVGQKVRLRIVGSGQFIHPMHLHGQPFRIVATDGNPVPEGAQLLKDTVLVGPGERYDVEFVARAPGKWLFHCHINHHITNDGVEEQGGGGLTMIVNIQE